MDMQPSISLTMTIAPLEWRVAKDYSLAELPHQHARRPRRILIISRGDRVVRRYTIGDDARTRVATIANVHGEAQPLEGDHNIFLDLANTVASSPPRNSPEAARAFVKKWGWLSVSSALSSSADVFFVHAKLMRKALTDAERNGWQLTPDTKPLIHGLGLGSGRTLQPKNLLDFCWLELFAAFEAGLQFYRCGCGPCGKYGLLRGPAKRPGPDREYCDDRCRKKAGRARKARALAA
jgi:hypothetical protein